METGLVNTIEKRDRGRAGRAGLPEYLLVVYPGGDMQDRLLAEQQQFSAEFGLEHRLDQGQRMARNKPHITLASFQAGDEAESTLIRWIQRICGERRSFEIALNNYSGIPPHGVVPPGRPLPGQ
ncbi:MAG TPA: hypothetical protein VMH27_14165 [Puia sp.]|nr:hypothetical protein [Puia sp.]